MGKLRINNKRRLLLKKWLKTNITHVHAAEYVSQQISNRLLLVSVVVDGLSGRSWSRVVQTEQISYEEVPSSYFLLWSSCLLYLAVRPVVLLTA